MPNSNFDSRSNPDVYSSAEIAAATEALAILMNPKTTEDDFKLHQDNIRKAMQIAKTNQTVIPMHWRDDRHYETYEMGGRYNTLVGGTLNIK